MIQRIVRLCFKENFTEDFEQIFQQSKHQIKAFKGCHYLELCKDVQDKTVYYTISRWESEQDLNQYRQSDLFVETWSKTKKLFAAKPMAFSLSTLEILSTI
ncbi:MAG: antibiotic biosynthesis monooxygenase family protein [Saprospiraceae bacterium]